jgi:hypothetical protein
MEKDWSVDETINQIKHLLLEKDAEIERLRSSKMLQLKLAEIKQTELDRLREALQEAVEDGVGWYDKARDALKEGE